MGEKHYCDDEVDEAIRTVERHKASSSGEVPVVAAVPIDDVHPWWTTLRLPLTIIAISLLLFSISLTALAFVALSNRQNDAHARDVQACRDRFTAAITEGAAGTRFTSAALDNTFNRGLLELIQTGSIENVDPDALAVAIAENEESMIRDQEAVDAREVWEAAGSPPPYPSAAPTSEDD